MKTAMIGVALSALLASGAAAEDACSAYVGQTVQVTTFDQAIANLPKIAPKGEYETTAAYEARKAAATGGSNGKLIISKSVNRPPEGSMDAPYIRYDADAGQLNISTFAFSGDGFNIWSAVYLAGLSDQVPVNTGSNVMVVVSQVEKDVATYKGTNAFGTSATITSVARTSRIILEGGMEGFSRGMFPSAENQPWIVGSLKMSPEEAQRLKPSLRLAFVVQPKDPFLFKDVHRLGDEPTLDSPYDIKDFYTVLIADIQCGLLLDGTSKVLGAWETR